MIVFYSIGPVQIPLDPFISDAKSNNNILMSDEDAGSSCQGHFQLPSISERKLKFQNDLPCLIPGPHYFRHFNLNVKPDYFR